MILETVIGSALGGAARLAPEVIKFFDKKNDRAHELSMFEKQLQADAQRSKEHLEEIRAQGAVEADGKWLDTYRAAIEAQGRLTGNAIIDGASQLVRPLVTYVLLTLYVSAKASALWTVAGSDGIAYALARVYTMEDHALLSGILSFWFVDRSIVKGK